MTRSKPNDGYITKKERKCVRGLSCTVLINNFQQSFFNIIPIPDTVLALIKSR